MTRKPLSIDELEKLPLVRHEGDICIKRAANYFVVADLKNDKFQNCAVFAAGENFVQANEIEKKLKSLPDFSSVKQHFPGVDRFCVEVGSGKRPTAKITFHVGRYENDWLESAARQHACQVADVCAHIIAEYIQEYDNHFLSEYDKAKAQSKEIINLSKRITSEQIANRLELNFSAVERVIYENAN